MPLLMKVPILADGEDPAAIVSFEMEQMILPRLTGVHVPKFVAAGDFAVQPYIVMERIQAKSLLTRLPELPLPYEEVADIGVKIATALDALHRQHVIHLDIKPSRMSSSAPTGEAALIDFGLSHHDQLPDLMQEEFLAALRHRALHGAGAAPRRAQRSAQRSVFALGVLLYFFSTGVRPFGDSEAHARHAPPAVARPCAAAHACSRIIRRGFRKSCCAAWRCKPAWRYPTAAQLAFDLSNHEPDQAHRALRTAAPRLLGHRDAAALQHRLLRARRSDAR